MWLITSSRMKAAGSRMSARPRLTRCCWPPDNAPGVWSRMSARLSSAAISRTFRVRSDSESPITSSGKARFSATVKLGYRA